MSNILDDPNYDLDLASEYAVSLHEYDISDRPAEKLLRSCMETADSEKLQVAQLKNVCSICMG